jgi:prepilin signal peptidase PulO-like enzyme (type II secretory pathway)
MLRGTCRNCTKKISPQYPIVELLTGLVFASVGYFYSVGAIADMIVAVMYAFAFACLVVIVVYDWRYMEIPMGVMWGAIALFLTANVATDWYSGAFDGSVWATQTFLYAASAAVAFCFFFGLSYISDETWMGYGDAFIAIAIGLLLGPVGTFVALLIAFCVGAIYGVGLMLIQGKSSKTEIPFGPFLILGLYTAFIIVHAYPDLLTIIV